MKLPLSIDVGGTSIKVGLFDNNGKLLKKYSVPTIITKGNDDRNVINQIIDIIYKEKDENDILSVGIGMPGPVIDGVVLGAHNLHLNEINLQNIIKAEFSDLYIKVLNDANAACLGEAKFGSGFGYKNIVLITIGTGIGCGIMINNKIIEGKSGSTGEIGHICVEKDGLLCKCGKTGCLEKYASASAISNLATRRYNEYGKSVEKVTCEEVFKDYERGFNPAIQAVNEACYYLAIGIGNIINILNPDVIIIGGGVSEAKELLLEPIKFYLKEFTFYGTKETLVVTAKLHNDAALYGLSEIGND